MIINFIGYIDQTQSVDGLVPILDYHGLPFVMPTTETGWKADQDLGPWADRGKGNWDLAQVGPFDFEELTDKKKYNEGDEITTSDDPVWKI